MWNYISNKWVNNLRPIESRESFFLLGHVHPRFSSSNQSYHSIKSIKSHEFPFNRINNSIEIPHSITPPKSQKSALMSHEIFHEFPMNSPWTIPMKLSMSDVQVPPGLPPPPQWLRYQWDDLTRPEDLMGKMGGNDSWESEIGEKNWEFMGNSLEIHGEFIWMKGI